MSSVASHKEISFYFESARAERVVVRIGRDLVDGNWIEKTPVAAEHGEKGVHPVCRKPKPRPTQNVFEYFGENPAVRSP